MSEGKRVPGKGTLFVVAAPSGTGKSTLVRLLCEWLPNLKVSVSCTTRPKRNNEEEGKDYYFIGSGKFEDMVKKNEFLEHEKVFDYRYGTPRNWVENQLANGTDIILEIDWQGARNIRKLMPDSTFIFILPPSYSSLEQRLRHRGVDNEHTIERRMQDALKELSHYSEFDYLVINDNLDDTMAELVNIVESTRQGQSVNIPDRRSFAEQLMTEGTNLQ